MLEQALAEDSREPLHHSLFQAKTATYLQVLKQECDSEITLINDLLDLQRLESGQQVLEPDTIDLQTWLPEIVELFVQRAQERQQQISIDLPPELPALISDITCLKRILVELLNNACKYTPNGETIVIAVSRIEQSRGFKGRNGGFRRRDENDCLAACPAGTSEMDCLPPFALRLSVSNTGVEIPPAEISRIFDHFYRVPGGDRWNQGGSGLGLALVKNLVTCLGGTIRAESGAGATHFIVELPVQPPVDSSSSS
jgi:signal transduction histidine kinase